MIYRPLVALAFTLCACANGNQRVPIRALHTVQEPPTEKTADPTPKAKGTTLVGRIFLEDLTPATNAVFTLSITQRTQRSSRTRGWGSSTDGHSRFEYQLTTAAPEDGSLYIRISGVGGSGDAFEFAAPQYAIVDLTERLAPGIVDLGDIVLATPTANTLMGRLDDRALVEHYRASQAIKRLNGAYSRRVESALLEMGRRGGEFWTEFLRSEVEQVRAKEEWRIGDLEILTCLRMAEGKRPPLEVQVEGPRELTCEFPDLPTLDCSLVNADEDEESFSMSIGGDYRSGRFARCRIDVIGPEGSPIQPLASPGFMGGGMFQTKVVEPGMGYKFSVQIGSFVDLPSPGSYRLRIQYHDQETIDSETSVEGLVVHQSEEFTLDVFARPVEISRGEYQSIQAHIEALNVMAPVLLVSGHWTDELDFRRDPSSPADHLFHAGYRAVPALIEALSAPKGREPNSYDLRRRAWILGMLWNITGVQNPTGGIGFSALGDYQWERNWPTVDSKARTAMSQFGDQSNPIHREGQDPLVEKWRSMAPFFPVEFLD